MHKRDAYAFLIGVMLCACAAVTFPYKYYGLKATYYDGELLGPKPADDLDFKICEPTPHDASPCVVMLTKDLLALKVDYLNTKNQLIACQKGE